MSAISSVAVKTLNTTNRSFLGADCPQTPVDIFKTMMGLIDRSCYAEFAAQAGKPMVVNDDAGAADVVPVFPFND